MMFLCRSNLKSAACRSRATLGIESSSRYLSGIISTHARGTLQSNDSGSHTPNISRRAFSAIDDAKIDDISLPFSVSSLGLEKTFITPTLASIRQLPEVETAWTQFPSATSQDNLKRACDIFSSYSKGGSEHLAVMALLAECQQRLALYDKAVTTLDTLYELKQLPNAANNSATPNNSKEDMILAQAKVLWTKGDFQTSQELCESIIAEYDDLQETFPTTNLHLGAAMTGKALSQLCAMNSIDDAYSVRDYFRIALKFLERHPGSTQNTLPMAAAHANYGVAEAAYAIFLEETNNVSVPMDAALRTWFQGMQKAEGTKSQAQLGSPQLSAASKTLQASLQVNMAWGVLHYEQDRSDRLSKASEYAKKALASYDDSPGGTSAAGLRRVLTIVAECYHQAGGAVTAEGLFQSATDLKSNKNKASSGSLSQQLELQEAYRGYSELCRKWDKRESDAKTLLEKAHKIDEALPNGWKGKAGIYSSLWFWTPNDFL
jgi:tetratricopeptide (TPR) repeat protein